MNTPKPTSPEALRELILKDGRRRLGGKARVALAVAGLGLAGLLAWANSCEGMERSVKTLCAEIAATAPMQNAPIASTDCLVLFGRALVGQSE